jgi:hypothetical protein
MKKKQVLAERWLRMGRDGVADLQDVALQIGFPQWSKRGDEAVCAIAIAGIDEDMPPVHGRDFFDALVKAARALRQCCKAPPAGIQFFYPAEPPDDRHPYEGDPPDPRPLTDKDEQFMDLRSKGWEMLVERKILMQEGDSDERREVALQIGHPYWLPDVQGAACPIVLRGDSEHEIEHRYGDDPFAALCRALRAADDRFKRPQGDRHFFWPDGRRYLGDHDDVPLPFKRDPREKPGNWPVIAERNLLMERDGDPTRRPIAIRIGRPYWSRKRKEWDCPKQIVGLSPYLPASSGDDSYEALIQALDFFNMIYMRQNMGMRFFWPDGRPYDGEPLIENPASPSDVPGAPV